MTSSWSFILQLFILPIKMCTIYLFLTCSPPDMLLTSNVEMAVIFIMSLAEKVLILLIA